MIEARNMDGIEKSCRFVADILGDISIVPGTGALLHNGIDWVLGKIRATIDEYECSRIFTPEVANQLKIQSEYTMVISFVTDALKRVNAICYDDICFESDFFYEAKYDPLQLATSTIQHLEPLQEKEYADIHKALAFVFAVYILHWVDQKDFHLSLLSKSIEHEERISRIEQQNNPADNNCGESNNEVETAEGGVIPSPQGTLSLKDRKNEGKSSPLTDEQSMQIMMDFNLRCVRSMIEGSMDGYSWAHEMQDKKNLSDVEFRDEVGKRMCSFNFTNDIGFLEKLLPEMILEVLFCDVLTDDSVENVMNGTYPEDRKYKIGERLLDGYPNSIQIIKNNCVELMGSQCTKSKFDAAFCAFRDLFRDEAENFLYHHNDSNVRSYDNQINGMTLFVIYGLLGKKVYDDVVDSRWDEIKSSFC